MTWVRALVALPLGLAFGSFLTLVIHRVPAGESVVRPRSTCPSCGTQLRAVDTVPIVSWIALRGRCHACGARISVAYPLTELATAGLFVAAALVSLLTIDKIAAWIVVVIIGRELAVTGLRAVSAGHGVIVPASRLAKWKTVTQYVAVTMLILEKGILAPGFHAVATGVLWVAVALTIVSAVDYFYRFFRKADYRAIVPDEERWS